MPKQQLEDKRLELKDAKKLAGKRVKATTTDSPGAHELPNR